MSQTTFLEGSQVSDIKVVGSYTYNLYTRMDGFYAIVRVNSAEDEFRYYIGLDEVKQNPGDTTNVDADWTNPAGTGIEYSRLNDMSQAQKALFYLARSSFRNTNQRDFK